MCNPITTAYPERLLSSGIIEGYEWEVTHNTMGSRCGYVRLPKGHPWFGMPTFNMPVECHGGCTFSEPDTPCTKTGEDDGWWIGFDCAHSCDAVDPELPSELPEALKGLNLRLGGEVRTQEYVEAQCASIIAQAMMAAQEQAA